PANSQRAWRDGTRSGPSSIWHNIGAGDWEESPTSEAPGGMACPHKSPGLLSTHSRLFSPSIAELAVVPQQPLALEQVRIPSGERPSLSGAASWRAVRHLVKSSDPRQPNPLRLAPAVGLDCPRTDQYP